VGNLYNAHKNLDQSLANVDRAGANRINTCNQYATTETQIARCDANIQNIKIHECATSGDKLTICKPGGPVDQYLTENR